MAETKYYGVFDAEGASQGFYADDIYPPQTDGTRNGAIPAGAVEITADAWGELLLGQPFSRYIDGSVTHLTPPEPGSPGPSVGNQLLYEHENRILALEGLPPLSVEDFIAKASSG